MAKHSKRHNIRHKKAATDAKKSKVYAKIGKLIQVAARKWADPFMNPALDLALQKAKYYSLPKDVVDKAIKKGSGEKGGEEMTEVMYEAFGPGGVALYIKTLTSNTNRTSTNVKVICNKYGGSMWQPGSTNWQFEEKGVIIVDGICRSFVDKGKTIETVDPFDATVLEEQLIELPITDLFIEEGVAMIQTAKVDFIAVKRAIEALQYHIQEADIRFLPTSTVAISEMDQEQLETLLDMLDDDEDVEEVFHNAEV